MGTTQTIPNWLRYYTLKAYTQNGDVVETITSSDWEPRALRITFDVLQTVLPSPYWYADIDVYNLTGPESQKLLNATRVTLEAGYQSIPGNDATKNNYGVIWDGPILQMLFDQQNVVDQKFTFHCIASIPLLNDAFLQVKTGMRSTQYDVVQMMIAKANAQVPSATPVAMNISLFAQQTIQAKTYLRGKGFFGQLPDFLETLSDDNFLVHYLSYVSANLTELAPPGQAIPDAAITYGPPLPPGHTGSAGSGGNISRTIIGVPRQTNTGIIMTVLLDPRLKVHNPPIMIHIDNSIITQVKIVPPNYVPPLPQSLNFFANQIRHRGDSRGNAWYSEVNGFTPTYAQLFLKSIIGGK